ncbi:RNA-directed DNA polymerase [Vagococcus coleopterorum]|uniref:RNA-directed DNA polymerase n=1 Tax=Vagococcus coleopterorum TaxID=2714946 RepID=A0A6G8ALK5_9ENTE|nr:reverse transcriptase family protein [Vagococcus coleopterorum]QIL45842.1 RNA-directed DNA polymerase [Vagococcus coleopterorum]
MYNLSDHIEHVYKKNISELIDQLELDKKNNVEEFNINKNNGTKRNITMVVGDCILGRLQSFLSDNYFNKVEFPINSFGFRENCSYFDFLDIHCSSEEKDFLKLDLKDFFSSIDAKLVCENLAKDFERNVKKRVKLEELFFTVITFKGKIPQGFKTSPFISNYFFVRADLRFQKYCDKLNYQYSRYADDIIISSNTGKDFFVGNTIAIAKKILADFNLKLNSSKTKYAKNELVLNGYVISNETRLSQSKLREIRRVLFIMESSVNLDVATDRLNSKKYFSSKISNRIFDLEYLFNYLSGYRSFLISSIQKKETGKWKDTASKLIKRIEAQLLRQE